ncbi:RHS repeat domain-containing protein [Cerasicoccus maritimus]|uniref:RHS repeat domain-containing protein n=1 Tax=Cerasicoccus maritimus TaxID=490089 RepID=UPI002852A3CB|nr:fibronectin type III domain-containing protein [Cerasicoccus maritimus]
MKYLTFILVSTLLIPVANARSHQFDDLGRLTRVAYPSGGGIAYTYDLAGNLLNTTTLDLPAAPSGFTATRSEEGEAVLSWVDEADNETEYRVYRLNLYPDGQLNPNASVVATLPAGSTTYTDTNIYGQTNYEYWVVAVNDDGESAQTLPKLAIDPTPFVIKTVTVESAGGRKMAVTWNSISGDYYSIQTSTDMIFWDYEPILPNPEIYTGSQRIIILGNFSGDESTVEIELPESESQVFVRVVHR